MSNAQQPFFDIAETPAAARETWSKPRLRSADANEAQGSPGVSTDSPVTTS